MEYLSRSRLPVFTPRLDLTAEDLNAEAETLCAAINELAGRLFIIKDMIPKEERAQYAEEESYPILDEIERIWEDIQRAWETIEKNKEECEAHYEETMERITELDERLNKLIQDVKQELLNVIDVVDKKHETEEERIENKFDISFADLEKRFNALDDAAARKADLAKLFDRIQYIQDNSVPNIGVDGYWYIGKIRTNTKAQGEPGQGVPTGGRTGSVLMKRSDKNFDTYWGEGSGTRIWKGSYEDYIADKENIDPIYDLVVTEDPVAPVIEPELVTYFSNPSLIPEGVQQATVFTTSAEIKTDFVKEETYIEDAGKTFQTTQYIINQTSTPFTLKGYKLECFDGDNSYIIMDVSGASINVNPGSHCIYYHEIDVLAECANKSIAITYEVEVK